MPDALKTLQVACSGGLITSMPEKAQSANFPGSARELYNLFPTATGGYKRIYGFEDYSGSGISLLERVPYTVTSGYTTGSTTVRIAGVPVYPSYFGIQGKVGDIFKLGSSSTEYTVTQVTSVDVENGEWDIDFTPAIDASSTNRILTYQKGELSGALLIENLVFQRSGYMMFSYYGVQYPYRLDYKNGTPAIISVGTTVINSVTYPTITLSNIDSTIFQNQVISFNSSTFGSFAHIVVESAEPNASNECTIAVEGALSSYFTTNPSNFSVSFQPFNFSANYDYVALNTISKTKFRFPSTDNQLGYVDKILFKHPGFNFMVDVTLDPVVLSYCGYKFVNYTDLSFLDSFATTTRSAIEYHKNQLFYSNGAGLLSFTAPYTYDDTNPANGAGSINIDDTIIEIISFNDQLIIFCSNSIYRLVGSTAADFKLELVSRTIYALDLESIQEYNNDIIFLSAVGFVLLSSVLSNSVGNISLSDPISTIVDDYVDSYSSAPYQWPRNAVSYIDANDGHYRFHYFTGDNYQYDEGVDGFILPNENAEGVGLCQTKNGNEWFQIKYFCISAASTFKLSSGTRSYNHFVRFGDPKLYISGGTTRPSTFGTDQIITRYSTPYFEFDDPSYRKTFYKIKVNLGRESDYISSDITLVMDDGYALSKDAVTLGDYFGTVVQVSGSAKRMSIVFENQPYSLYATDPYEFDSLDIEYMLHDRR